MAARQCEENGDRGWLLNSRILNQCTAPRIAMEAGKRIENSKSAGNVKSNKM